jgi:thiol-disulfide isomerase/thioredoxin
MRRLFLALATVMALELVVQAADSNHERVAAAYANSLFPGSLATSSPTVRDGMADQIVVYSATWCMPCQRLHPVLMSLKQEGYQVTHRDVDGDVDQLEYKYNAVPTIYFVRNNVVIKTETGYRSKAQIKQQLMLDRRREPHNPAD